MRAGLKSPSRPVSTHTTSILVAMIWRWYFSPAAARSNTPRRGRTSMICGGVPLGGVEVALQEFRGRLRVEGVLAVVDFVAGAMLRRHAGQPVCGQQRGEGALPADAQHGRRGLRGSGCHGGGLPVQ